MAIVSSMWLRGAKKRLGGTVIYQAMGQTRQRELASEVSNPRTQSQMGQRVKWANLVNLYRANRSWMKYAYETRKSNQSEYNKFMSLNVASSRIYLTKDVANAGGCVVDEYLMTQGSLPSIEFVPTDNGYFASNIVLTAGTISPDTTIAAFSQDVIANNPAIREGDQLSFVRMTQMTNASTGVPYVVVREYEVIINSTNSASLWDYLPVEYFYEWGSDTKYLAVGSSSGKVGGFCMILSRTISGKTYVSSQRVILVGMNAFIQAWSSQTALQSAIDSYGVSDDAFLSSTYAAQDTQAATLLSLMSVNFNGRTQEYTSWSRFVLDEIIESDDFIFSFNGQLSAVPSRAVIVTNKGTITLTTLNKAGNTATGTVDSGAGSMQDVVVISASITLNNEEYSILFRTQPSDFTQGIE